MLSNPPVTCVKCAKTSVVLTKTKDPNVDELRWRYRCIECGTAWWVDDDEYWRGNPTL